MKRLSVDRETRFASYVKRMGITKKHYLALRSDAIRYAARNEKWRPSELAMTLVYIEQVADRVWR